MKSAIHATDCTVSMSTVLTTYLSMGTVLVKMVLWREARTHGGSPGRRKWTLARLFHRGG